VEQRKEQPKEEVKEVVLPHELKPEGKQETGHLQKQHATNRK